MKFKATLTKTSNDKLKSRINPLNSVQELVLDIYISPKKLGELIEKYSEEEFWVEIK